MYCVIQKITNKKPNKNGTPKEIISDSLTLTIGDETITKYTHRFSEERFERPIRGAYKVMIHKSYREDGKVKKKQWVICTVGYYDLIDSWIGDLVVLQRLRKKLAEIGIDETQLWEMVYLKIKPLTKQIEREYQLTEEYRVYQKHKRILDKYKKQKEAFKKKFLVDYYDRCYDVFGKLKNPEYLQELEDTLRQRQQYQESSYQGHANSNYGYEGFDDFFGSYSKTNQSNYTDDEKQKLKKIHRHLSKTFHPDITKDDGEMMKLINKLKEGWGI